ncbi:MAG: TlpA disulfide reductase family protein [Patescibacteria group bacterium]
MMNVSRFPRAAVIGVAMALLAAVVFYMAWQWRRDAAVGEREDLRRVQQFVLKDREGKEVRQADFAGTPVLIYVWASWCPQCAEGLQDLAVMKKEFGDAISVVAINRAESHDVAAPAGAIPGAATGTVFLLDPDDTYYRAIGGFAMPETMFVDRAGMIRFHTRGPQSREELRRRTEDLLTFCEKENVC